MATFTKTSTIKIDAERFEDACCDALIVGYLVKSHAVIDFRAYLKDENSDIYYLHDKTYSLTKWWDEAIEKDGPYAFTLVYAYIGDDETEKEDEDNLDQGK